MISVGMDGTSPLTTHRRTRHWLVIILFWLFVALFFASQWYLYDATHGEAERVSYYIGASAYLLAVLTPAALKLAWRFPITSASWRRHVPLHLIASLGLTGLQVLLQAGFGWVRGGEMTWPFALRHYFSHIEQISFLTYWLLLAAALFYRAQETARASMLRTARLEAQLSAARLEMLAHQLHPHFLFNTLQAATTLVHDDPDRAEEILLRLSELLRVSLKESEQEITLSQELEILEHYIAIQTCRFGDRLQFKLQIDSDVIGCAVPSLLLQPLVENAVQYGIGRHRKKDTITVRAESRDDLLKLSISNNSSSLNQPMDELFGRGVGLSNTRDRLVQLYGSKVASLHVFNMEPTGVCAEVTLPLRNIPPKAAVDLAETHE